MTTNHFINQLGVATDSTSRQSRFDSLSILSRQSVLRTYLQRLASILLLVLTVGVGNAWGVVVKDTITIEGFAGNTTSGYVDTENTGATNKGIGAKMNHWNPSTGQIKVNQGNTSSLSANNFLVYNSDAMPGNITKIELVITSTSNAFTNNYCQVTASSSSKCNSNPSYNTSNAVSGSIAAGKSGTLSKTFSESSGYKYFRISFAKQGGTVKASYVIITYEYHTITYNGNENTGGSVPVDATKYRYNQSVTVKGNTGSLVKTGYTFSGWNTKADGSGADKAASATFSITQDTTLYAKWVSAGPACADPSAPGNSSFFWTPLFEPFSLDNFWLKTHMKQVPYFLGPISYPAPPYIYYVYIP